MWKVGIFDLQSMEIKAYRTKFLPLSDIGCSINMLECTGFVVH